MSLVLWNLIKYCKISQYLIKFCKTPKDLIKIFLKWVGKAAKYCLNFINFCSCTEKWLKFGQLLYITLMNVYGIPRRFSWSQTFGFNKISTRFISFMTEIFRFMKILLLLSSDQLLFILNLLITSVKKQANFNEEINCTQPSSSVSVPFSTPIPHPVIGVGHKKLP
jgi:hypothetical protein